MRKPAKPAMRAPANPKTVETSIRPKARETAPKTALPAPNDHRCRQRFAMTCGFNPSENPLILRPVLGSEER